MPTYDQATLSQLLDGDLPWAQIKGIMSAFKDADRFDTMVAIHQERVPWDDQILLPLGPHLFVVETSDGRRVTKSRAGTDFGDYRQNWKLTAHVRVRRAPDEMRELYPHLMHATEGWMELREYLDPADGTLLEVEAVPPGYPVVHSFQPDLETFYRDWLGRPLAPEAPSGDGAA